jgi:hypothetical protein
MKKQKINWLLYLILGVLSIGIIAASLLVRNCDEWFTIISGIGCGALASVLIAYLIELANVSQKSRKNISIFESYFGKLYFSFSQLLSSFVIACDKENRKNIGELYWFNWLERLTEEQIAHPTPSTKSFLIDKFKDTNVTILAHDGGGTEFGIDKDKLKIYLFDHDEGLLTDSLSITTFLSLGKKVIKDKK